MCGTWFGQSGKRRRNPRQYGTKKLPPPFIENYYLTLSTNSGVELWRHAKLKPANGFCHSLLEWSFPRNKSKISRLLKFYQVKQLKENSTENSTEKNFKEDSQFKELWSLSTKKKKKKKTRKILKFKKTLFPGHSQISSSKLYLNLQHFIFSISFLFSVV